jgi:hypothetical protein
MIMTAAEKRLLIFLLVNALMNAVQLKFLFTILAVDHLIYYWHDMQLLLYLLSWQQQGNNYFSFAW